MTELIVDLPGGGFVSMSPEHHEERLRRWCVRTGKPVLAVDYGKAPECECRILLLLFWWRGRRVADGLLDN